MKTLPIEIVPRTNPPMFRWRQTIKGMDGITRTFHHEGRTIPSLEDSLEELVKMFKKQQDEIESLKRDNEALKLQLMNAMDRIGAQSELLSKKAEKPSPTKPKSKGE